MRCFLSNKTLLHHAPEFYSRYNFLSEMWVSTANNCPPIDVDNKFSNSYITVHSGIVSHALIVHMILECYLHKIDPSGSYIFSG